MAGQFELLFTASFTTASTVTVTHNLNRIQVGVMVRVDSVIQNNLIVSITPLEGDPRNAVVIILDSAQSGEVLITDTDYVFANIPTPEGAVIAAIASTDKTTTVNPTVNDDDTLDYVVGSRWINTAGPSEFICSDASTGAAVWTLTTFIPVGAVYADYYNSAAYQGISGSASTLPLNTTRQSNAAFTLASNEVTINTRGTYRVDYDLSLDENSSSDTTVDMWLEVNGSEVGGTRARMFHDSNMEEGGNHGMAILTLAATDVLRIRAQLVQGSSQTDTLANGTRLLIHTIGEDGAPGAAGPQGPTGSGSNVTIEDEGSSIPNTPHSNLNFTGAGVTASDAGSGVATINIPGVAAANIAQYRRDSDFTINTSATTVALNATDFEDSNFTAAPLTGLITINADGVYRISYSVYFDTNTNARRTVDAWVENNSTEIVPSRSSSYARNTTDDTSNSSATFLVELVDTDVVRLRCQSTGTNGTCQGIGDRVWIALEYVRAP